MVRLPVDWQEPGVPSPNFITSHGGGSWPSFAKVELRDDTLLFNDSVTLPLKLVPFLDGSDFSDAVIELTFGKGKTAADLASPHIMNRAALFFPKHRKPDFEPAEQPFRRWEARNAYLLAVRSGVTLLSPDTVKLFHCVGDRLLVSDEPAPLSKWRDDPKRPKPPPRNLRTGALPKGFGDSQFAVYAIGGRHYLVTDKGTVYVVEDEGKDKVVVKAVWTDAKRRVFGVYSDSDGAVYGFGYDGPFREPNRFFLRLDPKPVAVPYKMTVKVLEDSRQDGFREAYECGRAVWKASQKKEK